MEPVAQRLAVDARRLQADERSLVWRCTVLGEPRREGGEAVGVPAGAGQAVGDGDRLGDRLAGAMGEGDGERL